VRLCICIYKLYGGILGIFCLDECVKRDEGVHSTSLRCGREEVVHSTHCESCVLQYFGVNKCPLQKNWSAQLCNPKKRKKKNLLECKLCALQFYWSAQLCTPRTFKILGWTSVHSKKIGVHTCALQFFWSGHFSTPNWSSQSKYMEYLECI
jgi:hypothetical protein